MNEVLVLLFLLGWMVMAVITQLMQNPRHGQSDFGEMFWSWPVYWIALVIVILYLAAVTLGEKLTAAFAAGKE